MLQPKELPPGDLAEGGMQSQGKDLLYQIAGRVPVPYQEVYAKPRSLLLME
jgi:hypothetical protein